MGPQKRATNNASPSPLVNGEYIDMVRDYKRHEKRQQARNKKKDEGLAQPGPLIPSPSPPPEKLRLSPTPPPQTGQLNAYDSDSNSGFDSDEFEDVELDSGTPAPQEDGEAASINDDVIVSLSEKQAAHLSRRGKSKGLRKPQRLALHKLCLIAWMYHARMRNKYLMSSALLSSPQLKNLIPQSVLSEIFAPAHLTSFLKSRQFVDGVRHAMEIWQHHFHVTRPGLACNQESMAETGFGESGDFPEYTSQLLSLEGSLDLMGQGFVALLRAIGLKVRLVSSFQPPDNLGADTSLTLEKSNAPGQSNYPIFWAEVWDEHTSKWMSVDPVTSTVRLPTRTKVKLKLEPPQSDRLNVMRYCIALDEENSCRDVTRRYAKEFNSRTRKKRLPHFESSSWLDKFLGVYASRHLTSVDKDEILELAKYPRMEGIPTRVQDFVGHPFYALADHLRSSEIIKPGAAPCGVISANSKSRAKPQSPAAGSGSTAYIYRRDDVENVRSSQSWYKRGRSIKVGAQPLARRNVKNRMTGETDSVGLYSVEQTEVYVPPPVGPDGVIPKSQYRTIDVFTSSMIPKGAHYIRSKLGTTAAKMLKIDFANVVTGVDFGKNGPQSRMFGVLVADGHAEAMRDVILGLREIEQEQAERSERLRILNLWRKFILGVQIWDRVEKMNPSYHSEPDQNTETAVDESRPDLEHSQNSPDPEVAPQRDVLSPKEALQRVEGKEGDEDSDIEFLEAKPLLPPPVKNVRTVVINTSNALRFQQSRPTARPTAVIPNKIGSQNRPTKVTTPRLTDSPESHHSFSDLDVDEISESEL